MELLNVVYGDHSDWKLSAGRLAGPASSSYSNYNFCTPRCVLGANTRSFKPTFWGESQLPMILVSGSTYSRFHSDETEDLFVKQIYLRTFQSRCKPCCRVWN